MLLATLALLLALGLAKMAADASGGAAQDDQGSCGAGGLTPVGDSGLCTHGPDPFPPGTDPNAVDPPATPTLTAAGVDPQITCVGDGQAGKRVQVLYVRPSNEPSRANFRATTRSVAVQANQIFRDSAAATGGSRSIRFVHDAECRITVTEVVAPPDIVDSFFTFGLDFWLADHGYDRVDRKYLMFVDANVVCGIGTATHDDRRDPSNKANATTGYARVDIPCWTGHTAAHEVMHTLGGVQLTAPNTSLGGHCVDEYDVMCYPDSPRFPEMRIECSDMAAEDRLDCNHDDYFHTNPRAGSYLDTRWNAANNQFLIGAVARPKLPAPTNDDLGRAIDAGARPFRDPKRIVNSATGASDDPWASCAGNAPSQTVWYKLTPSSSAATTIETTGSPYPSVLSVWTGRRGALTQVACDVDSFPDDISTNRIRLSARAGATYYIMVDSYYVDEATELTLNVTRPDDPPPPGTLTLSKDKSKFNGLVEATVSGLRPNAAVTLRWPREFEITSGPNDGEFTSLLDSATTDGQGRATFTFKTPLEPYGDYEVAARDPSGGKAVATLRVIPRILLNETEGPTDTNLRVYFYGFAPNERIEVRWHAGGSASSSSRVVKTLTVAGNGRASALVTIPSSTGVGDRLVVGKVVGVSRSASTTFGVTAGGGSADGATATPARTTTATATPEASPSRTVVPDATATPTEEPTATAPPVQEPTATAEPAPTEPPDPTETPVPTEEPTATPIPNASPIAAAGEDRTLLDVDGTGDEPVQLDASGSTDPEGGPLTYAWSVDGVEIATGAAPSVTLPVGTTTVTLTVTDAAGATASDEVSITVEAVDPLAADPGERDAGGGAGS